MPVTELTAGQQRQQSVRDEVENIIINRQGQHLCKRISRIDCVGNTTGIKRAELLIDGRAADVSSLTDAQINILFPD